MNGCTFWLKCLSISFQTSFTNPFNLIHLLVVSLVINTFTTNTHLINN